MIQQFLIGVIFLGAVAYLGTLAYRSFQSKRACASGCGKCGVEELNRLEDRLSRPVKPF